jgi:hypothetical protein
MDDRWIMHINNLLITLCLILSFFACTGCGIGPKSDELQAMAQKLLDTGFSDGLFKVESFQRMGAYQTVSSEGKNIVLVYFDAKLIFKKDYSMANWNSLNLDTLLQVLGAGSKGIDGINPQGNKKGDALKIHGSIALAQDDKKTWIIQSDKPLNPSADNSTTKDVLEQQSDDINDMLKEIKRITLERVTEKDEAALAKIHTYVRVTRNRLIKRMRAKRNDLIIACGHVTGTYYPLGNALAEILTDSDIPAYAQQTEGSVENCRMVSYKYADIAICQNDIVKEAFESKGIFDKEKMQNLRSICAWYPEAIQIFVPIDSPIKSVGDLRGTTVVAGQIDSGTRTNAIQILRAAGFSKEEMPRMLEAPGSVGFNSLKNNTADAIFITEAYPPRALKNVSGKTYVRMLSLDKLLIDKLVATHPSYQPYTVNSVHFRGLGETIETVAVLSTLITNKDVDDNLIENVLRIQYLNLERMIKANPKGATISIRHGLDGLTVPLHPGAEKFFKEHLKVIDKTLLEPVKTSSDSEVPDTPELDSDTEAPDTTEAP